MHRVELKDGLSRVENAEGTKFLMHRVELKAARVGHPRQPFWLFLMHRVELKAGLMKAFCGLISSVPNAPCGVERSVSVQLFRQDIGYKVPNAPCGVERVNSGQAED
jgi:hypothetical protein